MMTLNPKSADNMKKFIIKLVRNTIPGAELPDYYDYNATLNLFK